MSKRDVLSWKRIKVSDVLCPINCNKLPYRIGEMPKEPSEKYVLPAIAAGYANQGIACYVPIEGATVLQNVISVAANGDGYAFYQPDNFTIIQDAYALERTDGEPFTEGAAMYIVACLQKLLDQVFGWTNKSGWNKLKEYEILLPVTPQSTPDWAYMQEYIAELEQERIAELEQYLVATGLDDYTLTDEDLKILSSIGSREGGERAGDAGVRKEMREFLLKDIAILHYGNKFDKNKMTSYNPSVNFVSRTATNNGISDFVDIIPGVMPYPAGTITLAFGGSIGSCFVQDHAFYTGQNVGVIEFPDDVQHEAKVYFTEALGKICKAKYVAFGDEINKHFKTDLRLRLPIQTDPSNHPIIDPAHTYHPDGFIPDWDYMATYIRAIEKLVIKDVVDFKNEFIAKARGVVG